MPDSSTATRHIPHRVAYQECLRALVPLQLESDAQTPRMLHDDGPTARTTSALRTRVADPSKSSATLTGERIGYSTPPPRADRGSGAGQIPRGVDVNGVGTNHAPSRNVSLYAHYKWLADRAFKQRDAVRLYLLAGLIHKEAQKRPAQRAGNPEAELLEHYVNVPAAEAAILFMRSEAWVHRTRTVGGRDAEHGRKLRHDPRTRGKNRERNERILTLRANGASSRTIAAEVGGISHTQVTRIINGDRT